MPRRKLVHIENAPVLKNTNFRGEERRYNGKVVNEAGKRNFCVIIEDPDMAQRMAEDGWNIRATAPGEDEEGNPIKSVSYLPVEVGFKFPPEIIMETERGVQTDLDESTVNCLDEFNIVMVDVDVSPKYWDDNGVAKIKAYANKLWVLVEEDPWMSKHRRYSEAE